MRSPQENRKTKLLLTLMFLPLVVGCGPPTELSKHVVGHGGSITRNDDGSYWVFLHETDLTDKHFQELLSLESASQITKLNLFGTNLTDAAFKTIDSHQQIIRLDCRDLPISDYTVKQMAVLANLKSLELSGTEITSAAIPILETMTQLEFLAVGNTDINHQELNYLRAALSNCDVIGNEFQKLINSLD